MDKYLDSNWVRKRETENDSVCWWLGHPHGRWKTQGPVPLLQAFFPCLSTVEKLQQERLWEAHVRLSPWLEHSNSLFPAREEGKIEPGSLTQVNALTTELKFVWWTPFLPLPRF